MSILSKIKVGDTTYDIGPVWGKVVGSLTDQTDVQNALDAKSSVSVSYTGTSTNKAKYITVDGVEWQLPEESSGSVYESLTIASTTTTLAELATIIDNVNTEGKHIFFDFHNFISGAYVCLVQKYTEASVNYLYIFDLLNRHIYGSLTGYTGTDTIANYVATSSNNNDLPYVLKITDTTTTIADVIAKIDRVNALGQHVFIDVSALNTADYLVTFTYTTGASITACKALGLVKGVEAYRGYTTAELSTTLFSTFLSTAGDLSSYFVGTYAELKSLKDNSLLIPGAKYRMTDYDFASYWDSVFQSFHNQFDIVLTASTPTSFEAECAAHAHDGDTYFTGHNLGLWRLKYEFDMPSTKNNLFHQWGPVSTQSNGRGVIYDMIDDYGNHATYDFKNCGVLRTYFITNCNSDVLYYSDVSGHTLLYTVGMGTDWTMSHGGIDIDQGEYSLMPVAIYGPSDSEYNRLSFPRYEMRNYGPNGFGGTIRILASSNVTFAYFYRVCVDYLQSCQGRLSVSNSLVYLYDCVFDNANITSSSVGMQYSNISGSWQINTSLTNLSFRGNAQVWLSRATLGWTRGRIMYLCSPTNLVPTGGIVSALEHDGYTGKLLISVFDTTLNRYTHKILSYDTQTASYVYTLTPVDFSALPKVSSITGWNQFCDFGSAHPSLTLPTPPSTIVTTLELHFTFIADSTGTLTLTAPSGCYIGDDDGITSTSLVCESLTEYSLYEVSVAYSHTDSDGDHYFQVIMHEYSMEEDL